MKKDFYLVAFLTVFLFILTSLKLGVQIVAWRRLAFFLVHPTAGSFLAAREHIHHLGQSWRDTFQAREELDKLREEYKRLQIRNLDGQIDKSLSESETRAQSLTARWAGKTPSIAGQVIYRGMGERMWNSIACMRLNHSSENAASIEEDKPVFQFSRAHSQFILAGKTLAPKAAFGSFPCFELLTSDDYSLAVQVGSTGESAVVRGMNEPNRLYLEYVPKESQIKLGDRVQTSPVSLLAPPGILVGEVIEIEQPSPTKLFLKAYVKPYFDASRLQEILIQLQR